jgi:hypothetical protein
MLIARNIFTQEVTMNPQAEERRRVVQAPFAEVREGWSAVFNVELGDKEDVEWFWTHNANGQSMVTGYKILNKDSENTI